MIITNMAMMNRNMMFVPVNSSKKKGQSATAANRIVCGNVPIVMITALRKSDQGPCL